MSARPDQATERTTHYRKQRRNWATLIVLVALLVISVILALAVGASQVSLPTFVHAVRNGLGGRHVDSFSTADFIALQVRLPRVLMAVLVGAALAVSGRLMQIIFHNPLVSPYTLGISNGAAFGASLAIVGAAHIPWFSSTYYVVPAFAFLFAVLTMIVVYAVSLATNRSTATLLLTGVAIGYLFSAMVSGLKYVADSRALPELVFWAMGSFTGMRWTPVVVLTVVLVVALTISMVRSWDLNVAALGQEEAQALGVNYRGVQVLTFTVSTLLTATAVSFSGVIGFVGLVAPHIATMLVGADARFTLPGAALIGGILLLLSDTVARTVIAPTELPVGIITSLIGVPFFLFLVIRRRKLG
ncbi:FecCD family ABC transporter permease [Corynebacterium cystitidis]|uniref:FecCD family ABC transporter permease n=1 Tax=Corynebacterium cystitidis TaxID=35757 RepID=UPI00211E0C62|nr:iron ABC transporter permease [Corynebacterium cystitidis]